MCRNGRENERSKSTHTPLSFALYAVTRDVVEGRDIPASEACLIVSCKVYGGSYSELQLWP